MDENYLFIIGMSSLILVLIDMLIIAIIGVTIITKTLFILSAFLTIFGGICIIMSACIDTILNK